MSQFPENKKAENPMAPHNLILQKYTQAEFPHPITDFKRRQSVGNYLQVFTARLGPSEGYSRTSLRVLQKRNEYRVKLKLY